MNLFLYLTILYSILAALLKSILTFSKQIPSLVYLGGGCFFCHPQWRELLEFNKELKANVIIDVPLDRYVLDSITLFPPNEYNYQVSVSLWGIGEVHNKLSGTDSFILFAEYSNLLSQNMKVSFVVTRELICCTEEIINFINENPQIKNFYFHRLMPTGRCSDTLPNVKKIGSYFLFENDSLTEIDLPNVLEIKSDFLEKNTILTKINLPNVRKIANSFLNCNTELKKLELPNLVSIGVDFLYENECLKEIILPMVEKIGNKFLYRNESIKNLYPFFANSSFR